jgi:hypothetical protein
VTKVWGIGFPFSPLIDPWSLMQKILAIPKATIVEAARKVEDAHD